ncbi:MAG: hypothetical protein GXX90_11525, partial [Microbacteriaceae bacterium]|nr:hypothetical protein [Microbacteriaceae bacterium]
MRSSPAAASVPRHGARPIRTTSSTAKPKPSDERCSSTARDRARSTTGTRESGRPASSTVPVSG